MIAAQAPKLNMFSSFWQLVLDQNVVVIGEVIKGNHLNVKTKLFCPSDDNPTEREWAGEG